MRRRKRIKKDVLKKAYSGIIGVAFSGNRRCSALLLKALSLYNINHYSRAIALLEKMIKWKCMTDKEFAVVYFITGLCYDYWDQPSLAVKAYRLAIKNDSSYAHAYNNLGLIYGTKDDFNGAIHCYEKSLSINKNDHWVNNDLAKVYVRIVKPDKAIKYALYALKLKGDMYEAMNTLVCAYSLKNNWEKAEEYFQKSLLNGAPNIEEVRDYMNHIKSREGWTFKPPESTPYAVD